MFKSMRRKNNEISLEKVKQLLHHERRGILAVNGDDGYPYALPINYYYDEMNNKIYFHGAKQGYKVDALKENDKVCFTVYGNEVIKKEEAWAPFMQSAIIFGRCHLLEYSAQTIDKLKQVAMKYYPDEKMVDDEIKATGKAVQVYEITIEHLSGKQIQEK